MIERTFFDPTIVAYSDWTSAENTLSISGYDFSPELTDKLECDQRHKGYFEIWSHHNMNKHVLVRELGQEIIVEDINFPRKDLPYV